jgi:hypothetical protein
MVGSDDDFGEKYDIRAISSYLRRIDAPWDYEMTDEELEQFRHLSSV